jgi:hypothetical protein
MLGGLAALTIALQAPAMVQAGESGLEDAPPPEAVEDVATPIERGFKKEERPSALFPRLKQALQDQPPFLAGPPGAGREGGHRLRGLARLRVR